MNSESAILTIFMGLVPLIAFVIVDALLSAKAALIATIVLALAEAVWTFAYFKELDEITLFTLASVLILALISYKKKTPIFLKLQPAILSFVFATALIATYFMGKPFLLSMMVKYQGLTPDDMRGRMEVLLQEAWFRQLLTTNTWTLGIGLYLHALLTTVAAYRLNNWWWLALRGVGFYAFILLSMLAAKLISGI